MQQEQLTALRDADAAFDGMKAGGNEAAKVELRQQQLLELLNAQRKELALIEPRYRETTRPWPRFATPGRRAIAFWRKLAKRSPRGKRLTKACKPQHKVPRAGHRWRTCFRSSVKLNPFSSKGCRHASSNQVRRTDNDR